MWMILAIIIVAVPVVALGLYGAWNNHQVDKHYETHGQETA